MKLTWFAHTTIRIHLGGQILVADAAGAPNFVDQRELVSAADRVFSLLDRDPGIEQIDAAHWRPRPMRRAIDAPTLAADDIHVLGLGPFAVLVDAPGERPLVLLAGSAVPRFGRWVDDAVVVLFGAREGLIATATVLLDVARPRLIALAADEETIDVAIAELREHLDGAALLSLEPGLAVEV